MDSSEEIGVCEYCGHNGPKEGFYSNSRRFCTAACSHSFSAKHRFGKTPRMPKNVNKPSNTQAKSKIAESKSKHTGKRLILPSESERHQCISMGFDWGAYLSSKKATAASVDLFHHTPMSIHWGDIGNGMKIEVLNLDCYLNTKVYWIASVVQIAGYKAKLRYEGFGEDESYDFWCNLCTLDVNAVGWCATIGKPLVPPQTIQHKYTDWKSFLVKKLTGAKTLPSDFQKRITESVKSPFLCNSRLEVVDKTKISRMRVGIVNEVVGGRLRLKYEDSDYDNDDFWCHSQSSLIHPIGWCERVGHKILVSSKDYKARKGFKNTRQDLFAPVKIMKTCGFKIGMKLEAIDPLNLSAICVATVKKVLKSGYLMIGIDGSEAADGSDWFCYHCTAPSIFPVGFCVENAISLSVPTKFKDTFSWESYLVETDSIPAPVDLFDNELPDHGFKAGMKLEAVDLMEPRLICVATVTKVVGRLLHVHFDGWESQYDQWVDCESPDIYPVGWCELVGFDLQPPPNMMAPIDPSTSKKKKVKGQSFVLKKKRKKSLNIQKKQTSETRTSLKGDVMETSTETQQTSSSENVSFSSDGVKADHQTQEDSVAKDTTTGSVCGPTGISHPKCDDNEGSDATSPTDSRSVSESGKKIADSLDGDHVAEVDPVSDKTRGIEQPEITASNEFENMEQSDSSVNKYLDDCDITTKNCDTTMQKSPQTEQSIVANTENYDDAIIQNQNDLDCDSANMDKMDVEQS